MKNYERPVVVINDDLAEGVYSASGCWKANGAGKQTSVSSRGDFRFQIDGTHTADEAHAASIIIKFVFDQKVKSAEFCGYQLLTSGIESGVYEVRFCLTNYNNGVNATENFGGGALNVKTYDETLTELTLTSVEISDAGPK